MRKTLLEQLGIGGVKRLGKGEAKRVSGNWATGGRCVFGGISLGGGVRRRERQRSGGCGETLSETELGEICIQLARIRHVGITGSPGREFVP